jgi:hypothetical protein
MNKRGLIALLFITGACAFCACSDSVYYAISKEVTPIEARIKGGPSNFAVFNNYMYVASASKLLRYKDGNWDDKFRQPVGRIKQLASTGSHLYALCYNDGENPAGSTALRRYVGDSSDWLKIEGDTKGYNTFQSIYSAGGELFIGAEKNDAFAILHVKDGKIENLVETGLKAMLCGAAFYETVCYLCTEGYAQNNDETTKTGGIYYYNAESYPRPPLIPNSNGIRFTGIISLKDSVAAIDRGGKLYAVTTRGISAATASLGRESTGALAVWHDDGNAPRLLLAGRSALTEGYTYGYMELDITEAVSSWNFREPGEKQPSSIKDLNKELYISTIGKESVTHLFQAPFEVDKNMTLFASTQKNGVWSYRERDKILQWNAER